MREYFDEIQDVKVTKDTLDLAKHIVNQKSGRFESENFEDHYETALVDLINQKRSGKPITPKERPRGENVVDLMDTLRKSVRGATADTKAPKKGAKKSRSAIRLRHQLADIFSNRLGFGVAELTFGSAGEELHDAMLVDHDHCIRDRIQDRAKVPLASPDGVLEAFLTVDVDHDATEPHRSAMGTTDDGTECAHPVTFIRSGATGTERRNCSRCRSTAAGPLPCDRDPAGPAG